MKDVTTLMICLGIIFFFLLQPFHTEIVHLRGMVLESVLDRGIERAAVDGYFTPQNIQDMMDRLATLGFKRDKIEFKGTTTLVIRGGYIEGQLSYPMNDVWAMPGLFGKSNPDDYYHRSASQMSEYLP